MTIDRDRRLRASERLACAADHLPPCHPTMAQQLRATAARCAWAAGEDRESIAIHKPSDISNSLTPAPSKFPSRLMTHSGYPWPRREYTLTTVWDVI